jgi:hypothetical protein
MAACATPRARNAQRQKLLDYLRKVVLEYDIRNHLNNNQDRVFTAMPWRCRLLGDDA